MILPPTGFGGGFGAAAAPTMSANLAPAAGAGFLGSIPGVATATGLVNQLPGLSSIVGGLPKTLGNQLSGGFLGRLAEAFQNPEFLSILAQTGTALSPEGSPSQALGQAASALSGSMVAQQQVEEDYNRWLESPLGQWVQKKLQDDLAAAGAPQTIDATPSVVTNTDAPSELAGRIAPPRLPTQPPPITNAAVPGRLATRAARLN